MLFDKYHRLLNEGLTEYIDDINTIEDLHQYAKTHNTFVYSRADRGAIESLASGGASREFSCSRGAHLYGYGFYCTTTLEGEQESNMYIYGDVIVKSVIPGFDRCLIQRNCRSDFVKGNLANVVHGGKSFKEQVYTFVTDPNDAYKLYRNPTDSLFDVECIYHEYNIDGIILDEAGKDWAVWKDFKRIIPYEYSLDNGRTWRPMATQRTVDITAKTWEPNVVFGKRIKKYYLNIGGKKIKADDLRLSNGYFRVQTDKGFNLVDPRTRKETSPVWFDLCTDVQDNGVCEILYNGTRYYYEPSTGFIYEYGDDLDSRIEYGDVLCTVEDLDGLSGSSVNESSERNVGVINEVINEYIPDIDRNNVKYNKNSNEFVYFYRLAHKEQTESIKQNGFSKEFRGTGKDNTDWVGSGTYGNLSPRNRPSPTYGEVVWCYATPASVVTNGYITPHSTFAKRYNIPGTYGEQLERFFPEHCEKWKRNGLFRELVDNRYYSGSQMIRRLNNALVGVPIDRKTKGGIADHILHEAGVKGYIYHGNNDGDCVLTTDDGTIIPVSYKRLDINDVWHDVEIVEHLWNRTYNYNDPLAFLGGSYIDYDAMLYNTTDRDNQKQAIINGYRVTNGYMLVKRKYDGKYNLVKAPEGRRNFASPLWFDLCTEVQDNGVCGIVYDGCRYFFEPSTGYVYDDGDDIDSRIEYGDVMCAIDELSDL